MPLITFAIGASASLREIRTAFFDPVRLLTGSAGPIFKIQGDKYRFYWKELSEKNEVWLCDV